MPNIYALLIGIDDYDDRVRNGIRYPKLSGCVRDISQVYEYLTGDLRVPVANIIQLTAPRPGTQAPAGAWPTYSAIVAGFNQLLALAREPGDHVYVHYSGHGGRAATIYPELKGDDKYDETLVPVDIGDAAGQYLRDVEVHNLIQQLIGKGLDVTVVFDSCHSGGATRGEAVARGIEDVDMGSRPVSSAVASVADLAASWGGGDGATRSVAADHNWLLEPQGYTFIAACRPNESAYEYSFAGSERNGALTYFLLDTLRRSEAEATFRTVMARVVSCIHGAFQQQSPMLQGEADRVLFGAEVLKSNRGIGVLGVDPSGKQLRLHAGEVQGIAAGVEVHVFRFGTDLADPQQRIAVARVDSVDAAECAATVTELLDIKPVAVGDVAVLQGTTRVELQVPVRVALNDAVRPLVESAIERWGNKYVFVAGAADAAGLQIGQPADGSGVEIQDAAGIPLARIPRVHDLSEESLESLVKNLVHVVRFRQVISLLPTNAAASAMLKLELVDQGGNPTGGDYRPGDSVTLRVSNPSSSQVINCTVFLLSANWAVTKEYPLGGAEYEPLDPGASRTISFTAGLPPGATESLDTFKVFACKEPTPFSWLEMPKIGEENRALPESRNAGDPLVALFDQWAQGTASMRDLTYSGSPDPEWTTAMLEVVVRK